MVIYRWLDGETAASAKIGDLVELAIDLAINWTLFHGKSREAFQKTLPLDQGTWVRARAWTLCKALVVAAEPTNPNNSESKQCWRIIEDVIADHKKVT